MRLLVNGCSHAAESRLDSRAREPSRAVPLHPFGRHVAEALGGEYVNLAEPGGSNERIVRTTLEWLSRDRSASDRDLFVVIMWTVTGGFEYYDERANTWRSLCPGVEENAWYRRLALAEQRYFQCHRRLRRGDQESETRHWLEVLLLQGYLAARGIPYLFCNAFHPLSTAPPFEVFRAQLDIRRFLGPFDRASTYWQASLQEGFVPEADGHFGEDAHRAWAATLTRAIRECDR